MNGAGTNGAAVNWALGAALGMVALVAGRRLVRTLSTRRARRKAGEPGPGPAHPCADSAVQLVMAAGMVVMTVSGGGWGPNPALRAGFGVLAVVLVVRRFHHAAMFGIMALMAEPARTGRAGAAMTRDMAMPQAVGGPSLILLAAFCYVCVFALVFAWRMPTVAAGPSGRGVGVDPLGHACEIVMLISTAVMLLPML